jgi:hypothetical protein
LGVKVPTPFDNLTSQVPAGPLQAPDRGVFGGLINTLFGPTANQERAGLERYKLNQAQAQGGAQAALVQKIGELVKGGANPTQAITQIFADPQFHDVFANSPNLANDLQGLMKAVTAPVPATKTLGPGESMYSIDPYTGKPTLQASKETAAVQSLHEMGKIARLTPDQLSKIAGGILEKQAAPTGAGGTEKERAVVDMVRRGELDPAIGRKVLAGVYKVIPTYDKFGSVVGNTIFDLSTGTALQGGISGSQPGSAQPGEQPGAATGEPPHGSMYLQKVPGLDNPAEMFVEGVGVPPDVLFQTGGIGGQAGAKYSAGPKTTAAIEALRNLRVAVQGLRNNGRMTESQRKMLDDIIPSPAGWLENPTDSLRSMIAFDGWLTQQRDQALRERGDPNRSKQVRAEADQRIQAIDSVRNSMPSPDEMQAQLEVERNKPGVLQRLYEGGKKIIQEETKGVQADPYGNATMDELKKLDPSKLTPDQLISASKRRKALLSGEGKTKPAAPVKP